MYVLFTNVVLKTSYLIIQWVNCGRKIDIKINIINHNNFTIINNINITISISSTTTTSTSTGGSKKFGVVVCEEVFDEHSQPTYEGKASII